jgi:3-hydroxyisobutyrate dehydrogenase-like beta-hydroxyacid dehydrogenase
VEVILSEAEELKIDLPLISLAKKRLIAIKESGITDKDISFIWKYYEEIAK